MTVGCSGGGAIIVGFGAAMGAAFFLGLAFFLAIFFLAIRLAFFFAPFLAFRFLGKQSHRCNDEVKAVISFA